MVVGVQFTVTGFEEVLRKMHHAEVTGRLAVRQAVLRMALLVERIAKDQFVPVVSGRLKASIGGQSWPAPHDEGDALFQAKDEGFAFDVLMGSNVVYASVIEFGRNPATSGRAHVREAFAGDVAKTNGRRTGNGRHGPFLRPALAEANLIALPLVKDEIAAAFLGMLKL